jgi:hypothetical protein
MAIHASMTPNVALPGGTLTIQFDGTDDVTDVDVRVFEVDDQSQLEPVGKNKLLVTFHGQVKKNKFSLTAPAKKDQKNPEVRPGDAGAPEITIEIVGDGSNASAKVALPDKTDEQGVFELRFDVTAKSGKFSSSETILVRAFAHFQVKGVKRPVIAFIATAENDAFFTHARNFWKLNADAVLARKGMSLKEILDVLDAEGKKFGKWGQINICAHGREAQISMKAFPAGIDTLHADGIEQEIKRFGSSLPKPSSIDADTEVVFRSCNAGNEQGLIDAIRKNFFPSAKFVKVPKFPQVYESTTVGGKLTSASEFFEERLSFDRRTPALAKGDEAAGLSKAYDGLVARSPGLDSSAVKADELATFSDNHDFSINFSPITLGVNESVILRADGKPMSDSELVDMLRKQWVPKKINEQTAGWQTNDDRWELVLKRKNDVTRDTDASALGVLFRVTAGTGKPMFRLIGSGALSFGASGSDFNLVGKGLESPHATVTLNGDQITVKDNETTTGVKLNVGGKTIDLKGGAEGFASFPASISLGGVSVEIRRGKAFQLIFEGTRFFVDRRRTLRTFDKTKAYSSRPIHPLLNLDDARLFGTSS